MSASDWVSIITSILMVLITVAYVIATIRIQKANEKAAKASNDQLEESKRQFNENRRLDVMPYLQFEISHDPARDYVLELPLYGKRLNGSCHLHMCIKNIGRGTAKDILFSWTSFECQQDITFPFSALQNGESYKVKTVFEYEIKETTHSRAYFGMKYKDLLENDYVQKIEFLFGYDQTNEVLHFIKMKTYPPVLIYH